MPGSEIAAPLNQVLVPGFAKLQHSPHGLATAYVNVLGSVSALTFPAGIGLAMVAHEAVLVFLGNQWLDAVSLVSVFAVFGGIRASNSLAGSLLLSTGHVATAAAFGWLNAALLLAIALPLVGVYGALGIASAKLAGAFILAIVIFAVVTRVTEVSAKQILASPRALSIRPSLRVASASIALSPMATPNSSIRVNAFSADFTSPLRSSRRPSRCQPSESTGLSVPPSRMRPALFWCRAGTPARQRGANIRRLPSSRALRPRSCSSARALSLASSSATLTPLGSLARASKSTSLSLASFSTAAAMAGACSSAELVLWRASSGRS